MSAGVGRRATVAGLGTALPERIVTNADFADHLDTSDAWITERTGIRERRFGGSTADLATAAGQAALADAGLLPADIQLLVLCTETPDRLMPATSAEVAHRLGLHCGAFDLNAACSGFVYGLVTASSLVDGGLDRILLVGADTMSRITDQDDRATAVLFADGAGALVLTADVGEPAVLGWDAGTDGSLAGILSCEHGGKIAMEGRAVYQKAVRMVVESCLAALEKAKATADDIAVFAPHQANIRIIEAAALRLGIPPERCVVVLDRTGNTSAGSIPLALADARDTGRLQPGDLVLMSGFGAGMTWASAVWRW